MHECKTGVRDCLAAAPALDAAAPAGTHDALPVSMLDAETAKDLIKPHMRVVGEEGGEVATVDQIEGHSSIKLTKDGAGQHHYIPLEWVTSVDDKVHVDRTRDQAMREWTTSPVSP